MEEKRPRILVFATGEKEPEKGGSGFQELVEFTRTVPPVLDAEIVGVVSNYPVGGICTRAAKLQKPFVCLEKPFNEKEYEVLVIAFKADFVMCSGWLKPVRGLDPAKTINIHPGPLPNFGGPGKYGHHVHEAVIKAYARGEIKQSAVSMHFVTPEYDQGPIFFELPVLIRPDDTSDTLASRINEKERAWQAYILNLVVHGLISYVDDETIEVDRGVWNSLRQFIPVEKVNVKIRGWGYVSLIQRS